MFYKCIDAVIFTEEDLKITTDKKPFIFFKVILPFPKCLTYLFLKHVPLFSKVLPTDLVRARDPEAKINIKIPL